MTRTLAVTQNITLDGVIDGAEGWFLPTDGEHVDESDVLAALRGQSAGPGWCSDLPGGRCLIG